MSLHTQRFEGMRSRPRSSLADFGLFILCVLGSMGLADPGIASGAEKTGAKSKIALPGPDLAGEVTVERALASRRSVRAFASAPLRLSSVSQLLWAAQGITDPRGLRTAPSAGALYPLEVYLVAGRVTELPPGVYRYDPSRRLLQLVREGDRRARIARAARGQDWIGEAPATLVITAVYERTERKYGERARRYVHMEVGHAAQNVYLQAGALGLGATMVGAFDDEALARELDLLTHEKPLALLPVGQPPDRAP